MENLVKQPLLFSQYHNKNVFITGHTGFKGAWLMAWLHSLGANVKGYALPPDYADGLYDHLQPLQLGESVLADIRDKQRLQKEIHAFNPDIVFHLAAQPLVRRSYEIPAETFEINAVGTANLLEAIHRLPGKCSVVVITTDKVYENKELDVLYQEDDRLGGYDPYSASKACTELVVNSFRSSFFNPRQYNVHQKAVVSARAGNVIGGGDWSKDRLLPDIIRALQQNTQIDVRNPHAVRPWQHVLEPLAGYLLLGGLLQEDPSSLATAYNFGPLPEDHLKVNELIDIAIACWGNGSWKDISHPDQPHEAGLLKLDINRAMQQLYWQPKLGAARAVEWTVNWYKQPAETRAAFTFQQIKEYTAL